jgi:hypothetical protein
MNIWDADEFRCDFGIIIDGAVIVEFIAFQIASKAAQSLFLKKIGKYKLTKSRIM